MELEMPRNPSSSSLALILLSFRHGHPLPARGLSVRTSYNCFSTPVLCRSLPGRVMRGDGDDRDRVRRIADVAG
jgi:hypothetical protein